MEGIGHRLPAVLQAGAVAYGAAFKNHIASLPPTVDGQVKEQLARHAGPKGNICGATTASRDMNPLLVSLNSSIEVAASAKAAGSGL